MESLLRASERNRAPHFSPFAAVNMYSSRPNGVSFRSGSPPVGSTMMTSAPSSEKWDEHQWPMTWFAVQSRTRSPSRDSGLSALNCCRTADSTQREYPFFFSSTPAYTSSTVGGGIAGQGRTLILGRFFSVRHFSAILPLLVDFADSCHYNELFFERSRAFELVTLFPSSPLSAFPVLLDSKKSTTTAISSFTTKRYNPIRIRKFHRNSGWTYRNTFYFISRTICGCQDQNS
ncbi:MAG: hypothetical protein HW408_1449, partial [Actinobacteria bacterium]|nr:hypothetical protein [Actinomycetota bacterium]